MNDGYYNIAITGNAFDGCLLYTSINPSLLWEHRFNELISSSISTDYMYTSGRYKFTYAKKDGYDTTAVRQNGDVRMLRLENAFFGKVPKGEWKAKAYLYNSERGYPGAAVREEPVSYTHLDVYKRQVEQRPTVMLNTPWNDSWVMPCLLYTSSYTIYHCDSARYIVTAQFFFFFYICPFRTAVLLMAFHPFSEFFVPYPGSGQVNR